MKAASSKVDSNSVGTLELMCSGPADATPPLLAELCCPTMSAAWKLAAHLLYRPALCGRQLLASWQMGLLESPKVTVRNGVEHQLSRFPSCNIGCGNCPGCFLDVTHVWEILVRRPVSWQEK